LGKSALQFSKSRPGSAGHFFRPARDWNGLFDALPSAKALGYFQKCPDLYEIPNALSGARAVPRPQRLLPAK